MKVLIVEPGQYPREAEIEKSLESEQAIVGGLIECAYPWQDNACIVCNDEGKLQNLPLNRTLGDYDIIAGTFFVVGLTQDDFCSLTPEQVKRYEALYHDPQLFYPLGDSVFVENCSPERYRQVMNPEEHQEKNPPPKHTSTPER